VEVGNELSVEVGKGLSVEFDAPLELAVGGGVDESQPLGGLDLHFISLPASPA